MSQKKEWVNDKDESWLKIEKGINGHAYMEQESGRVMVWPKCNTFWVWVQLKVGWSMMQKKANQLSLQRKQRKKTKALINRCWSLRGIHLGVYSSTNASGPVQLESESGVEAISKDPQIDVPLFVGRPEPTSATSSKTHGRRYTICFDSSIAHQPYHYEYGSQLGWLGFIFWFKVADG